MQSLKDVQLQFMNKQIAAKPIKQAAPPKKANQKASKATMKVRLMLDYYNTHRK